MMIASTSSTFWVEATPAPSAAIARSIRLRASGSPRSSARAQTPLVRRVRPRSSMILNSTVFSPRLGAPARAGLHRGAAGVGLHAAAAAAAAAARRPGARRRGRSRRRRRGRSTGSPSSTMPPPTPVPQKTPSSERYGRAGAERELRVGGDLDVVAERHRRAAGLLERASAGRSSRPSRAGSWRPTRCPASSSTLPGEPMPMPVERRGLDAGLARPPPAARRRSRPLRRPGRRSSASDARLAGDVAAVVDDDRLDLGAAEVDSAGVSHEEGVPERNVSCVTGSSRRGISVTVMESILSARTPAMTAAFPIA